MTPGLQVRRTFFDGVFYSEITDARVDLALQDPTSRLGAEPITTWHCGPRACGLEIARVKERRHSAENQAFQSWYDEIVPPSCPCGRRYDGDPPPYFQRERERGAP